MSTWVILAVRQSANYFFAANFSIYWKSLAGEKETGNYRAFCFINKRKNIISSFFVNFLLLN